MSLPLLGAGPTGSGGFSPADLEPLVWLEADALALADGAAVATWPDSSGNGNDATQATGANQPVLKTGIVNGLPVVRFDSTNDSLSLVDLSALTAGTVFCVTVSGALSTGSLWHLGNFGDNTFYPFGDGDIYDGAGSTARKNSIAPASPLAEWHVYTVRTAAGAWANFQNGTQLHATGTNTVAFPAAPKIGAALGAGSYGSDIAELLIYNSALADGDRESVESYLINKYGL